MVGTQGVGKEGFLSEVSKRDLKIVSHMVYVAIT